MRTFARQPKTTRDADSLLHLQHTIGNQAVRRLQQAKPDDGLEAVSGAATDGRIDHDFSRIPVDAKTPTRIQPRLALNTPGDNCEQEADRISEQVMRTPEPPQRLQTNHVHAGDTRQIAAPPIVHEVLAGPSQPLDQASRGFMEQRFGHDFGGVRVHADARAAESARAVNALAYTVGRSIAFGAGQYKPDTEAGRRLLSHELTHVLQQSGGDGLGIQRQEQPVATSTTTEATTTATPVSTPAPTETAAVVPATDPAKLSGKTWWVANEGIDPLNKKSSDIADLEADFQGKVNEFKKALDDAGASISIDTTTRPKERAHVLHYAWEVAKGNVKASAVPAMTGVDIVWDHGNDTKSKAGAQEIITAASVASTPSLTSNHIAGKAIDWTITWAADLKIKKKDGAELVIKSTPRNGGDPGNTELHEVGKGYGVIKGIFTTQPKDPPHWSFNGK